MKRTKDEENLHRQTQATWEAPFPEGSPGDKPSPRPPARLRRSGLGRSQCGGARWAVLSAILLAALPSYAQPFFPSLAGANDQMLTLAQQPDGKLLVGGEFTVLAGETCTNLGRLSANYILDTGFAPAPNGAVSTLIVQADGKIIVGGQFSALSGHACANLGRLDNTGALDPGFQGGVSGAVSCLALQADGKVLVAGDFTVLGGQACTNLGRVQSDGTLDTTFNPGAVGPNTAVALLATFALRPDGSILVGGSFAMLDETPCPGIGRVDNTGPATEALTFDGSTISWLRGGTAPDVWRTTFEASTNGADWVALGAGTYIPGGWQLTNVTLPPNARIRARGFVATPDFSLGWRGAGGWFVESLAGPPAILSQPASLIYRVGTNAALTAVASGAPPLSYQWLFNGAVLPGATCSLLSLANIQPNNAGQYAVAVSNSFGSMENGG